MQISMELNYDLKKLREIHPNKPTQRNMADYLGMTEVNYNKLEMKRTKSIRYDILEKLCDYFDCTPNELFGITPKDTNCQVPERELVEA